ncbi:MAG: putative bifunctional diguanylate cyclase/phosphodiesterase [Actinomycetes bacterium]
MASVLIPGIRGEPGYSRLWEIAVYLTVFYASSATCLLRAWMIPRARAGWLALGVGMFLYASGGVYFSLITQLMHEPPYPSPADGLWLSFYPCAFVAIVLFVRHAEPRFQASMWLDGLIAGLGGAGIAAAIAFGRIADGAAAGSFAAVATNLAYPVGDLILLLLVLGALALLGPRAGLKWWLLAGGLVLFAAADSWFLTQVAAGTYHPGSAVDGAWALGGAFIAASAAARTHAASRSAPHGWAVLAVPSVFAFLALGTLAYSASGEGVLAAGLIGAALAAAFVRAGVTFREVMALADLRRQSRTDELTGLANRRALDQEIGDLSHEDLNATTALLLIDLKTFAEINDSLGSRTGDELLREAGRRLAALAEPGQTLARISADQFALLVPEAQRVAAEQSATRVIAAFRHPLEVTGLRLILDVNIGIAVASGSRTLRLATDAQDALARAKTTTAGIHLFSRDDDRDAAANLQTVRELDNAIDAGELVLYYQPQVSLTHGGCVGVEALVRWQHPAQGLLSPDQFLTAAEQGGLMPRLSLAVLGQATAMARGLFDLGLQVPVAVNLSPTNLLDVDLPHQIGQILHHSGLDPAYLELEITEQVFLADRHRTADVLTQLRALGMRVALDDFGTGFSSLTHLQTLPVDVIKLDRSFVHRILTDPKAAAIVTSLIDLSHALGLRVVAEGIEDQPTLDQLARLGCDLAQGYHLARPMPTEQLLAWLGAHARTPQPA